MKVFLLDKKKKISVLLLLSVFFLLFLLTQSNFIMFEVPERLDGFLYDVFGYENMISFTIASGRSRLLNFYEEINPFFTTKISENADLPSYYLELSDADIEYFRDVAKESILLGYRSNRGAEWRSVTLRYDDTVYDAKMKLHGNTPANFDTYKLSFNIKLDSGSAINNMRNIQFIIPEEAGFDANIFFMNLGNDLGMDMLQTDIVKVFLNGKFSGLYVASEKISDEYFERTQQTEKVIISTKEVFASDYREDMAKGIFGIKSLHTHPFIGEISMVDDIENDYEKEILSQFNIFMRSDYNSIDKFVAIEDWSKYNAWRIIRGDIHQAFNDNLRFGYSLTSGLFSPIARVESLVLPIQMNYDTSFEYELNVYGNKNAYRVDLIDKFDKNDILRNERNKILYKIVSQDERFIDAYKYIHGHYRTVLAHDISRLSSREIKYLTDSSLDNFIQNLILLKNRLELSRVYIHTHQSKSSLDFEIIPDSNSAIVFDEFILHFEDLFIPFNTSITVFYPSGFNESFSLLIQDGVDISDFLNKNILQFSFDDNMNTYYRSFNYTIYFPKNIALNDVAVNVRNNISDELLLKEDIRMAISSNISFKNNKIQDLLIDEKTLFLKDIIFINQTTVVPNDIDVIIDEGTEILLSPGTSFLIQGNLIINGSQEKPVFISWKDVDEPFGTFAVVGNNDCFVDVNYLNISGGSEDFVNGMYFSGAFAIYRCNTLINNSAVHSNFADDGLNIKNAEVVINNSFFYNNFADQIDLDFCRASVLNSTFIDGGIDDNGDGLDLSGSSVIVMNNVFNSFNDKALSIGEKTKAIIAHNIIANSSMAIAVKDLSEVFFTQNNVFSVDFAIESYMKKEIFGGGSTYLLNEDLVSLNNSFKTDNLSKLFIVNASNVSLETNVDEFINNLSNNIIEDVFVSERFEFEEFPIVSFYLSKTPINKSKIFYNFTHDSRVAEISYFDTLSNKILLANEAYYLIVFNDSKEVIYLKQKGGEYYEINSKVSSKKTRLHAIEYAAKSFNNDALVTMRDTINLNEKLEIKDVNDIFLSVYFLNSSLCDDTVYSLEEFEFKKDDSSFYLIKTKRFPVCSELEIDLNSFLPIEKKSLNKTFFQLQSQHFLEIK